MFSHQNSQLLLAYDKRCLVSHWPAAFQFEILLTTVVDLLVVAGRSGTWVGRPQAFSRWPMLIHTYHAAPLPCCALALKSRFQNGMVWARHGHCMVLVNQTRPLCVNQIGKTQSKPLATRHGRGTAWARHVLCELASTHQVTDTNMETQDKS